MQVSQEDYRDDLKACIWDTYKEVNGIRPRWMNMDDMSTVELEVMADSLVEESVAQAEEYRENQKLDIADFEKLIASNISSGAADRENAIRWIREAQDDCQSQTDGFIEYDYGLPYGYIRGNLVS